MPKQQETCQIICVVVRVREIVYLEVLALKVCSLLLAPSLYIRREQFFFMSHNIRHTLSRHMYIMQ